MHYAHCLHSSSCQADIENACKGAGAKIVEEVKAMGIAAQPSSRVASSTIVSHAVFDFEQVMERNSTEGWCASDLRLIAHAFDRSQDSQASLARQLLNASRGCPSPRYGILQSNDPTDTVLSL